MKLYKTAKWYNPFSITVGNNAYELNAIAFFDKDGIICKTNHGWFDSSTSTNNDFDTLEIPGEVKRKKKVDFTEKQAFVAQTESRGLADYTLFIPRSTVQLSAPTAVRSTMYDRHWEVTWKTNIKGVAVTQWHFIDRQRAEIVEQINNIGRNIAGLWSNVDEELLKFITQLQEKKNELEHETARMEAITADDVLKNYR